MARFRRQKPQTDQKNSFRISDILVDPTELTIQKYTEEKVSIQPKFVEVLYCLAVNYPRVISREYIIEEVWDGNFYVGEKALNNAIWQLRSIFSQNQENTIETIRKVGYRLTVKPEWDSEAPESIEPEEKRSDWLKLSLAILLLIFSAIFVINTVWLSDSADIKPLEIIDITRAPGAEYFPSPSADGSLVVYSKATTGSQNLYLIDRDANSFQSKQLTFSDWNDRFSVWSHDNKHIYFVRRGTVDNECELIKLNVYTQKEDTILSCKNNYTYSYVDISADNRWLAVSGIFGTSDSSRIHILDLHDPSLPMQTLECQPADCSMIERSMAFNSRDENILAITKRKTFSDENIYLVNRKTGEQQQLTFGFEDIDGISWHPDGVHLIFAEDVAYEKKGYILNTKTKDIQELNIKGFSYPQFSRLSKELFYQEKQVKFELSSLRLAKGESYNLSPLLESQFNYKDPDFSDKADLLVYLSNESGHDEAWIADTAGQTPQQLTSFGKDVKYPTWSRQGDKIAFLAPSEQLSEDKIFIVDVASKQIKMLETPFKNHARTSWSYSDDAIISAVEVDEETNLFSFDLDSGAYTQLTSGGGEYGVMISANELLYTKDEKSIWRRNIDTQFEEKILEPESSLLSSSSWVLVDDFIYYFVRGKDIEKARKYSLLDKSDELIINLPESTLKGDSTISFSKKTNQLFFTRSRNPQSDIKVLKHPLL